MKLDINKFSFAQLVSNNSGKTSGSGTMGCLTCFAGVIGFLLGMVDKMWLSKTADVMNSSIIVVTIGAGLLGYRKSQPDPVVADDASTTEGEPVDPPVEDAGQS